MTTATTTTTTAASKHDDDNDGGELERPGKLLLHLQPKFYDIFNYYYAEIL